MIDDDGKSLGVLKFEDALKVADAKKMLPKEVRDHYSDPSHPLEEKDK